MNSSESEAVKSHFDELQQRLTPSINSLLSYVLAKRTIARSEYETISHQSLSVLKCLSLLELLKHKDNGFNALLNFLREHDGKRLADELQKEAMKSEKGQGTTADSKGESCAGVASAAFNSSQNF